MEGIIFDVKRFAVHDGPGIRTTVFFKGCSLDCWWCHNPESKNSKIEKFISTRKISDKTFEIEKYIGYKISTDDLLKEIMKESIFMEQSDGGITLSGGEPLLQAKFAAEFLELCKNAGIHTIVDTAGNVPYKNFEAVSDYTDMFLYDIKFRDSAKHKKYTDADNNLILSNFKNLIKLKKNIIVRIPLIPQINLNMTEMSAVLDFLSRFKADNFTTIELMPYHHIGLSKYKRFNKENRMQGINEPGIDDILPVKELFESAGFIVKVN